MDERSPNADDGGVVALEHVKFKANPAIKWDGSD